MFQNTKAFSGFSVSDIEKAKAFYGGLLGLIIKDGVMKGGMELLIEGNNPIMVYQKQNHIPAEFTILNFPVEDVEKAVDELSAKGIRFEHYLEFNTDEKGIHRHESGNMIAWFKDPAGNILSVLKM